MKTHYLDSHYADIISKDGEGADLNEQGIRTTAPKAQRQVRRTIH